MKLERILFLYHTPSYTQELKVALDSFLRDGEPKEISQCLTRAFGMLLKSKEHDFIDIFPDLQTEITKLDNELIKGSNSNNRKGVLQKNSELIRFFILSISNTLGFSIFLNTYLPDNPNYLSFYQPTNGNVYLYQKLSSLNDLINKSQSLFLEQLEAPLDKILVLNKEYMIKISDQLNSLNELKLSDFLDSEIDKTNNKIKISADGKEFISTVEDINVSIKMSKEMIKKALTQKDYGLLFLP